jgi:hypothetical protein
MPRFAAMVIDVAVGFTVFVVAPWPWVSQDTAVALSLAFPALMVPWEALWLRLTCGTVGHWLVSIRVVWPAGAPSFLRLCWRTVKRYTAFWIIGGQPSNVAPGVLVVETVPPIRLSRVSRLIDGDGIVATRGWSVGRTSAMFALCVAIPSAGIAAAVLPDELSAPLLAASVIWMMGAVLSIISVVDAWTARSSPRAGTRTSAGSS